MHTLNDAERFEFWSNTYGGRSIAIFNREGRWHVYIDHVLQHNVLGRHRLAHAAHRPQRVRDAEPGPRGGLTIPRCARPAVHTRLHCASGTHAQRRRLRLRRRARSSGHGSAIFTKRFEGRSQRNEEAQTRDAQKRPQRQESHEPQAGDRHRPLGGPQEGQEGAEAQKALSPLSQGRTARSTPVPKKIAGRSHCLLRPAVCCQPDRVNAGYRSAAAPSLPAGRRWRCGSRP
jgi:hypothetical protein